MRGKRTMGLVLGSMLWAGATLAAGPLSSRSPEQVVNHHIAAMMAGDPAALVADYADDAVVVFPTVILNGKADIQKMFAGAGSRPAANDGAVMKVTSVSGDVVTEEYTHRDPDGAQQSPTGESNR